MHALGAAQRRTDVEQADRVAPAREHRHDATTVPHGTAAVRHASAVPEASLGKQPSRSHVLPDLGGVHAWLMRSSCIAHACCPCAGGVGVGCIQNIDSFHATIITFWKLI